MNTSAQPSFKDLKRSSGNLEKLKAEIEKISSKQTKIQEDTRFWKPEIDKAGNGYAVIRFLPAPQQDGEDALPWVHIFDHGFQGPGGWYIEKSLTSLGPQHKDPIGEYNSKLWNSGVDANKEIVRKQKRRLSYYANILVVSDPKNPANDGKVFLYKFGKKIFNKIMEAWNPQFEDETPFNPFDFWKGANFKLKIRKVDDFRNYDKSEFETPSPLDGSDEDLQKIWKGEYSLKEFVDPKNFKSYDELKSRLDKVLGFDTASELSPTVANKHAQEFADNAVPSKAQGVNSRVSDPDVEGDLDDLDAFKKLAEQD